VDGWTARHLTHHFHAVTHAVKHEAVRALHLRPDAVTVVERGRNTARLGSPSPERRRRARTALGLPADAAVVLNVARQEHAKGQRDLVDAFAQLAPTHPSARLLIAGRVGYASGEIEARAAATGLGERIRILGHRDDVPELMAAADVFALPSLREGTAGTVIEAMALGLPVVTADLATIREAVDADKSALLVPPEQPARLAAAISVLLDDVDLARSFGTRGREIFEARYTLERSVAGMLALYDQVLASRRAARV
jgi:glycosyltransferase involved in cell wall biosynthesis